METKDFAQVIKKETPPLGPKRVWFFLNKQHRIFRTLQQDGQSGGRRRDIDVSKKLSKNNSA